jgi:hypothetical protein
VSDVEDSARWERFAFREGDIVISTRSKCGTTWVQMICALLVFQDPKLPEPLSALSPWLDWTVLPLDETIADLERQQHRRFVKTHTPLDGVPIDERATYIVVARDPRDMAISLYHQSGNLNRERIRELVGEPEPPPAQDSAPRSDVHHALLEFIDYDGSPVDRPDTLVGVAHHLTDAWRRRYEPNILLVHYADLSADLEAEMRSIASRLSIEVAEERWPVLVEAASFAQMSSRAATLVPDVSGVLIDQGRFFRSGTSGQWRELLSEDELCRYDERIAALVEPDLATWMHRGST